MMGYQVLEGTWEEVQRHAAEFTGKRVRIEVLNGITQPATGNAYATPDEWIGAFRRWSASHDDISAVVLDDSRAAIYEDNDRG